MRIKYATRKNKKNNNWINSNNCADANTILLILQGYSIYNSNNSYRNNNRNNNAAILVKKQDKTKNKNKAQRNEADNIRNNNTVNLLNKIWLA